MAHRTHKETHGLQNTQRNAWLIEHTKKHMAYRTHKKHMAYKTNKERLGLQNTQKTQGLQNTQRRYKSTKLIQEANTKIQKH